MRYGVKKQIVGDWIRFGELQAIDVRAPGATRPRFKILPADLAAFEAARATREAEEFAITPSRRRPPKPTTSKTPIGRRW